MLDPELARDPLDGGDERRGMRGEVVDSIAGKRHPEGVHRAMRIKISVAVFLLSAAALLSGVFRVVEYTHVEYVAEEVSRDTGVTGVHIFPSEVSVSDNFFKKTVREGAPLSLSASFDPKTHEGKSSWEVEISSPVTRSTKRISFTTKSSDAYGKVGIVRLVILNEDVEEFGIRITADGEEVYAARFRAGNRRTETFNEWLARMLSV